MNYFKILGIVFGVMALLKPVYMHLLPWDENKFIAKAYGNERPPWIIPVAVMGLFLVGFTWYKHFTTQVDYSIIISLIFSLTAIKAIVFIVDYKRFHTWIANMLKKDKGREIVIIDILTGIFGAVILIITFLFY